MVARGKIEEHLCPAATTSPLSLGQLLLLPLLLLLLRSSTRLPPVDQERLGRMYDRAVGAQKKANAAVDSITDVMMQIPELEKTIDGLKGSGVGPDVTLDGVTDKGKTRTQIIDSCADRNFSNDLSIGGS